MLILVSACDAQNAEGNSGIYANDPTKTPLQNINLLPTSTPAPDVQDNSSTTGRETIIPPFQDMTAIPEEFLCVQENPVVMLGENDNFNEYPEEILTFLNSGGTIQELQKTIVQRQIGHEPTNLSMGDLNGNQKLDLVVSLVDPASKSFPPRGELMIYTCESGNYALSYFELSSEGFDPPSIIHIQDINGDYLDDLITSQAICDNHTCYEDVKILTWGEEGFENRLDGTVVDLPFPNVQITDYDMDGIYQLEVSGEGTSSVAAGPPRIHTRIYVFDPVLGMWELSESALGPTEFRIHILHDANSAAQSGDYTVALLMYERVINDDTLLDWFPEEFDYQVESLKAYARFKLVVDHALSGDLTNAQTVLDGMNTIYPAGSHYYPFAEMAQEFMNQYQIGENKDNACEVVFEYAAVHAVEILTPLGQDVFGYNNPNLTPLDICP
ncbi:MAG: hypothetical protein JXA19_06810 [Anaerolineales bacterium]|nr:hypothetical protein [Anaerolineales bacterium]